MPSAHERSGRFPERAPWLQDGKVQLLLRAEQERETVDGVDGFAVARRFYVTLARADGLDGVDESSENRRLRDWNVMSA